MDVKTVPSPEELTSRLSSLGHAQVMELSRLSGVPFTTLWKVRGGETKNPRLKTVRDILAHIPSVENN